MNIIVALLVFSVIIFIHELGHFLLAKKNGIYVKEFSLGMGPRLLSWKGKETRYSIKLFPIGGSCMMLGEDEAVEDERAFNKKGVWARISVVAAGPIFNFLLAFVLSMFVVATTGYDLPMVTEIVPNYPAQEAGMKDGDLITKINGSSIDLSRDLDVYFQFHTLTNEPVEVEFERDGKEYQTALIPKLYKQYMLGFSFVANKEPVVISGITQEYKDYPLAKAGIQNGDTIVAINGEKMESGEQIAAYMAKNPLTDKPLDVTYQRGNEETTVQVVPKLAKESYTLGFRYNMYRSGKETNPITIIKYSYTEVKSWIKTTVASLGQMVKGKVSKDDIAGPVGIVNIIGDSYEQAVEVSPFAALLQMFYICILLSANLGVMNLLPIPALDGGRLVFLLIEAVRGKPIDPEKEGMVHLIGLVALMILMVFVVFNDVSRIFRP